MSTFYLHQTHHQIADFDSIFDYLLQNCQQPGIHLLPEMFLTGYPLQDLCLQASFIQQYQQLIRRIKEASSHIPSSVTVLMGGLDYHLHRDLIPYKIYNGIYALQQNSFEPIYYKRLLPNYDIFDEQKYFSPGQEIKRIEINGLSIGLMVCEDMWPSSFHNVDPTQEMKKDASRKAYDVVINLSASPFDWNKSSKRKARAQEISHQLKAPFIYLNRVGGEDEILFDGSSFVVNGDEVITHCSSFSSEIKSIQLPKKRSEYRELSPETEYTFENLLKPCWEKTTNSVRLTHFTAHDCQQILNALMFGLVEYSRKSGFKKWLVGVSGGMDSALVLAIAALAQKKYGGFSLEALFIPAIHSSTLSYDLSAELCQNLNVPLTSFPIKFLHSTIKNQFKQTFPEPFEGLTDENIQSRLRGLVLYTRSNQTGSMVINTSNRSEIAVGYSTQYGDSVGALSLIGDLYKSEVYQIAHYINQHFQGLIPQGVIDRAPSAELRPDQKDTDSLPSYDRLDAILEGILSYRADQKKLIDLGFDQVEITRVFDLYSRSEYKRAQFCPILKVKAKSFGFGYRVPINKKSDFYRR